jgi:hypothetical protein
LVLKFYELIPGEPPTKKHHNSNNETAEISL